MSPSVLAGPWLSALVDRRNTVLVTKNLMCAQRTLASSFMSRPAITLTALMQLGTNMNNGQISTMCGIFSPVSGLQRRILYIQLYS